jgi:hypothetical protein
MKTRSAYLPSLLWMAAVAAGSQKLTLTKVNGETASLDAAVVAN